MHARTNYAVTEVLSLITVVIIAASAITAVLFWALPQLDIKKEGVRIDSASTQFKTINNVIEDVISCGVNASNLVDFVTDAGHVYLDSKGERFIFYYSLDENYDFNVSELNDDDKTIFITVIKPVGNFYLDVSYINESRAFFGGLTFTSVSGSGIPPNTYECDSPWPLIDAVKMDIIKTSDDSIIGRIWLFDSGDISYEVESSYGPYRFTAENGGGISKYPSSSSSYLYHKPSFYNKDNSIVIKMIQLKSDDKSGGSGKGRYTFLVKSLGNYVGEVKANIYGYFKMQIYGTNSKAWVRYYTNETGFKKFDSPFQDTLYLEGDKIFSLIQSVCSIRLVTIK